MKALLLTLAMLSSSSAFASYFEASCVCTKDGKSVGPTFGLDYSADAALKGAVAQCEQAGGTVGSCSVKENDHGGGQ